MQSFVTDQTTESLVASTSQTGLKGQGILRSQTDSAIGPLRPGRPHAVSVDFAWLVLKGNLCDKAISLKALLLLFASGCCLRRLAPIEEPQQLSSVGLKSQVFSAGAPQCWRSWTSPGRSSTCQYTFQPSSELRELNRLPPCAFLDSQQQSLAVQASASTSDSSCSRL